MRPPGEDDPREEDPAPPVPSWSAESFSAEDDAVPDAEPIQDAFELPDGFENDETAELVDRAHAGDVDALNQLFERYHGVMVEIARRQLGPRLRLKEDPDDLAQTTFREATRDFSRYTYRGTDSLLRWLKQILHNKIRDRAEFYSAGKRDTALETNLDGERPTAAAEGAPRQELPSHDLSVTYIVQRDEGFEKLRDALSELRPEYRQAITLVFFQGLSLREAGERMEGRSEDAVRMMLRRAEAKLGDLLKGSLGRDLE